MTVPHPIRKTLAPAAVTALLILCASVFLGVPSLGAAPKGIEVTARTPGGTRTIPLYSGYYALVVACADYRNGWPKLRNPVRDGEEVAGVFRHMGWTVETLENPTGAKLRRALNEFIAGPGKDPEKGLLIFFSGHGQTLEQADGTKLGYIVPVDAPLPYDDEVGFMDRAYSMRQFETVANRCRSKHVLMVFDSCFSGAIFTLTKAAPSPYIEEKVAWPVRQFITAGTEEEQVPDQSVFKDTFIYGIRDGFADRNKDCYVTGEEIGAYLQEQVVNYSHKAQHPQYGKINNPHLDKGDFVFASLQGASWCTQGPEPGALKVTASVPGAKVYVDDQYRGTAPVVISDLAPGTRRLRITLDGYESWEQSVQVEQGRTTHQHAVLTASKSKFGRLYVDCEPSDARVRILNIAPPFRQGMELEPGRYHLEVSAEGYEEHEEWIDLDAGEDRDVAIRLLAVPKKSEPPAPKAGETIVDRIAGVEFTFAYIPPGTFTMGSPGNEPGRYDKETQRQVTLTRGYYLQTTEITQGQWKAVMRSIPSYFKNCGDDCPVENISWNDCQEFIGKLNRLAGGNRYRLPTEAEWEYAARTGTATPFAFGTCLSTEDANYDGNYPLSGCPKAEYRGKTVRTGSLSANGWGLYDMHGNVYEWCQDWYGKYPSGSVADPTGPPSGSNRVKRGGCWYGGAEFCRSAFRDNDTPDYRISTIGARLLRSYP